MLNNKNNKITLLFVLYFLFLWGGQLSAKTVSSQDSMLNFYIIPLYFFFLSRAIIWFLILKKMDLIKAYTISSINYLFIPFISYFTLKEPLKFKYVLGGGFIIIGIIIFRIGESKKIISYKEPTIL